MNVENDKIAVEEETDIDQPKQSEWEDEQPSIWRKIGDFFLEIIISIFIIIRGAISYIVGLLLLLLIVSLFL